VSKILFADLGVQPIPNKFLRADELSEPELFYPLRASFDTETKLVQLDFPLKREAIFDENYPYFSSQSSTFLKHAEMYAHEMIERFHPKNVLEIGSNDGYLLQYFKAAGVKALGVEPCRSVAEAAIAKGIETHIKFFGRPFGEHLGIDVDLMVANNVLAHVPDIDDFVNGFRYALAPEGVATFEFPHLQELIQGNQFDTIYHEHYSYLSMLAVNRLFLKHDLRVFDVDELPVHGGSLRVFACRKEAHWPMHQSVVDVIRHEMEAGLNRNEIYEEFNKQICATKRRLLDMLIDIKFRNKIIIGYGAPAKGNTLLNYCGIREDFLDFVVDTTPAKQGMYLPGSRLRVGEPHDLDYCRPDYVLILPWNFRDEIISKLDYIRGWGGRFIVPIPHVEVIS